MMASRAADTSVELGENTVTTTVVVRWDWKLDTWLARP